MDILEAFHLENVAGDRCHLDLHDAHSMVLGASI